MSHLAFDRTEQQTARFRAVVAAGLAGLSPREGKGDGKAPRTNWSIPSTPRTSGSESMPLSHITVGYRLDALRPILAEYGFTRIHHSKSQRTLRFTLADG